VRRLRRWLRRRFQWSLGDQYGHEHRLGNGLGYRDQHRFRLHYSHNGHHGHHRHYSHNGHDGHIRNDFLNLGHDNIHFRDHHVHLGDDDFNFRNDNCDVRHNLRNQRQLWRDHRIALSQPDLLRQVHRIRQGDPAHDAKRKRRHLVRLASV
jgi:hypothetical protein